MKERVSCIIGTVPVILIAPHGADDTNTDIIVEFVAKSMNCYAVINRGFERCEEPDIDKDKADCNKISHIKEDVICDEYLKPITKYIDKASVKFTSSGFWENQTMHVFHIHGCGNIVHKEAGEKIEVIVGYGLGKKKDSLTCEKWKKDLFVDIFRDKTGDGEVYEGIGNGKYAGRDSDNMNQYYRLHENRNWIQSMQLEFPYSTRNTIAAAENIALKLSQTLHDYVYSSFSHYTNKQYKSKMI